MDNDMETVVLKGMIGISGRALSFGVEVKLWGFRL